MGGKNVEQAVNNNFANNLRGREQPKEQDWKDPAEWSPPPKKQEYKLPKRNNNKKKQWGNDNNANANANVGYGNVDKRPSVGNNGPQKPDNRNYDKPWMVGIKKDEPKDKPTTFLENCSQNGRPVDEHLIQMLESEVIDSDLNVKFDDIAGNEDAKAAIEEACI